MFLYCDRNVDAAVIYDQINYCTTSAQKYCSTHSNNQIHPLIQQTHIAQTVAQIFPQKIRKKIAQPIAWVMQPIAYAKNAFS